VVVGVERRDWRGPSLLKVNDPVDEGSNGAEGGVA
jgi:hypothetical protein